MKTLLIGDGPSATAALGALKSHPRVVVAGCVSGDRLAEGLAVHASIESALEREPVDLVVFAGEFAASSVASAMQRALPVLLDNLPRPPAGTGLDALQGLTRSARASIYLARDPGYGGSMGTLRKFLAAGRLGSIGHVSIEDDRAAGQGADDGPRYWLHRGGVLLAQVGALLDSDARDIMARVDDEHGVTEAYLETRREIHVHYTGRWRAADDSHCLWIEGTKGSIKTDGRGVWWRKRGWRFFAPVFVGRAPVAASLRATLDRVIVDLETPSARADDRLALAIVLAALASSADRRPAPVASAAAA